MKAMSEAETRVRAAYPETNVIFGMFGACYILDKEFGDTLGISSEGNEAEAWKQAEMRLPSESEERGKTMTEADRLLRRVELAEKGLKYKWYFNHDNGAYYLQPEGFFEGLWTINLSECERPAPEFWKFREDFLLNLESKEEDGALLREQLLDELYKHGYTVTFHKQNPMAWVRDEEPYKVSLNTGKCFWGKTRIEAFLEAAHAALREANQE